MKRLIVLYYLILACTLPGQDSVLVIDEKTKQEHSVDVSDFIYVLPDSLGSYQIEDIVQSGLQKQFTPDPNILKKSGMESMQSISYYWVRISIQSSLPNSSEWFLFWDHPTYEVYYLNNDNRWQSIPCGTLTKPKYTELPRSVPGYKVSLAPGKKQIIYFKLPSDLLVVKTGITQKLDLQLFDNTHINTIERKYWPYVSIILGIFLAVVGYHLIIFLFRSNKDYLYFALFVLSYAVIFSSFSKLVSEWIVFGPANDYLILLVAMGWTSMYIFHYLFTRRYLNLKYLTPRLNRLWRLTLGLRIVLSIILVAIVIYHGGMSYIPSPVFNPLLILAGIMGILLILIPIISALKTWQKGWRPSIVYLLAMVAFVLQLFVEELNFQDIITLPEWLPIETGSITMVFLFALGLAQQMKMMEEDILASEEIILKQEFEIIQNKSSEIFQSSLITTEKGELLHVQPKLKVQHSESNDFFQINKYTSKNLDRHFINKIKQLILQNLSDPSYGIPQLCDDMAMSRAQLYRKFSSIHEVPIGEYIKKLRLQKAYEMLKQSSLNITQISMECGYSNLSSFSRSFTDIYGKAPSKIRKSMM
ncbi:MAG: helix-turn-helix domain-containing protein [Saprospiraceae bacterium]|nr:helix-turn-helix domain-containing protein [Saprospiraceae bacterium]